MIYMWFTGINYYKLAVEKDRDSILRPLRLPSSSCYQGYSHVDSCMQYSVDCD